MADELIRGNIDIIILKVLYEGDRYGYDMIKQINARSGGQWEIKQPTIYACLKRLEKQGSIKSYWDASESNGGRRKYYSLTELGREIFLKYKDEYDRSHDLFGSLSGEDTMYVDDFSDVEEESYAVPKRRAARTVKKSEKKSAEHIQKTEAVDPVAETAAETTDSPTEPNVEQDAADEQPVTEEVVTTEQETVSDDTTEPVQNDSAPETDDSYVQQSFFDSQIAGSDAAAQDEAVETADNSPNTENRPEQPTYEEPSYTDAPKAFSSAADPREIIDGIASSYVGAESYATASERDMFDYAYEQEPKPVAAPTPTEQTSAPQPTPPANTQQTTAPAPIPTATQTAPAPVEQPETLLPADYSGESLARNAYREILSDLIDRCEPEAETPEPPQEQAAADTAAGEKIEVKRFGGVVQNVTELGNEVTVRDHNDSAKAYTHKYYYYSHKLMMTHYTIMCAIMFVLGLTLFLTFYVGLNMRMRYDYVLYIFAGLLPIIMFITAVIIFAGDPEKKKRININFRFSLIIRIVILIQVAVVIYCFNLIWGMRVAFDAAYIPSIVLPLVYALFIPISEVIFMSLLRSERYAVE